MQKGPAGLSVTVGNGLTVNVPAPEPLQPFASVTEAV
jgi:hypothetical protein